MKKHNRGQLFSPINILIMILVLILIASIVYMYIKNNNNLEKFTISEEEHRLVEEENQLLSFPVVLFNKENIPIINPYTKKPVYSKIKPIGTKMHNDKWVTQTWKFEPPGKSPMIKSMCYYQNDDNYKMNPRDYPYYDKITGRYCHTDKLL